MLEVNMQYHIPVMCNEVLEFLKPKRGLKFLDATVGTGGHAQAILEKIVPGGFLVGIDRDEESLNIARQRLIRFSDSFEFVYANFADLDVILNRLNISKIDGMLFDLGVSSYQLENPQRGFSFQREGPLDMRYDLAGYISAYDLVNNLNEEELSSIFLSFGEERWHRQIARRIIEERKSQPILTTTQLSQIVLSAIPFRYREYRIHPATRVFLALRIAVNRELEVLKIALNKAIDFLNKDAKICIISFHSLEDRIVKYFFRQMQTEGRIKVLTPKPLFPSRQEVEKNPRARSAKLRVAVRL
ncbi:MAG: 16S rRNA (cytosine(1402)-N(4))-methyltransferase RsmH [Candidatus Omnitrophica bacterium]|nr:16S rRNA (cytosine(1402)-N(4))-methyltransferase RsmH [Candidatus Omnitrophota bacterium]